MTDGSRTESSVTRFVIPITVFLSSLLLIVATLKDYGITWDEPPYFHASDLHTAWIAEFAKNVAEGNLDHSLADETIKAAWHWDPYHVPHPPFSRIVSGLVKHWSSGWFDKFSAYRLGPALFFAVLTTVMYLWMKELFGQAAGLFSVAAVLLIPNLFGFAHIAVTDLPLASMWFLTAYCFWKGLRNWNWSIALGVIWGLALATKFPALLIPLPLILWAHLFHRDKYVNNVFAMLFLAPIVMVASQPYLWHQPGPRLLEFLHEGISRAYRPETNYSIYFFNQVYFTDQLPWYYPFFTIAVTTPEPFLALGIVAILALGWPQERRPTMLLFLINAAFIPTMGTLPGAVLHDGVRQLLSALPFIAALAGGGFYILSNWLVKVVQQSSSLQQIERLETKLVGTLFLLFCFSPALNLYLCHPFQLSYYNQFVGGVRGAYERGLETTYFMEAFTPGFLAMLNENLRDKATINASFANFMFTYYQKEGRLRRDIEITDKVPSDFYLLLNRRSVLSPRERQLMNGLVRPYLSVTIGDVPLVNVFEFNKPG
jgi:Dolichyl-phosphate-mannose-protein mannosyltransferase